MASITALGLTLAILACANLSPVHDSRWAAPQASDGEPQATTPRLLPPDSVPRALFRALGTVSGRPLLPGVVYIKDIVIVSFDPGTTPARRRAAFDAVGGVVVGGSRYRKLPGEGNYYLRVPGGTASSLLHAVTVLQKLPQVSHASLWELTPADDSTRRRM